MSGLTVIAGTEIVDIAPALSFPLMKTLRKSVLFHCLFHVVDSTKDTVRVPKDKDATAGPLFTFPHITFTSRGGQSQFTEETK